MTLDLTTIEATARKAQEKLEQGFDNRWSWFREIGPDVVLALVKRVREQGARIASLEMVNRDLLNDMESTSFESYKAGRRAFIDGRWEIADEEIADLREFLTESEADNNAQGDAPSLSVKGERALRRLLEAWEGK